jgi:hypothetical protein
VTLTAGEMKRNGYRNYLYHNPDDLSVLPFRKHFVDYSVFSPAAYPTVNSVPVSLFLRQRPPLATFYCRKNASSIGCSLTFINIYISLIFNEIIQIIHEYDVAHLKISIYLPR